MLWSSRKNLADHVFNRHLLNVNVAHGQIIKECLANGNHTIAFDFEGDCARNFFNNLAVTRQFFRRIFVRLVGLDCDKFEVGKTVNDFAQLAVCLLYTSR